MSTILLVVIGVCFVPAILSRGISLPTTRFDINCPECHLQQGLPQEESQSQMLFRPGSLRKFWSLYNVLPDSDNDFNLYGKAEDIASRSPLSLSSMIDQHERLNKRNEGPSLSVVNPVDVLRQRMLMEAARERMRQTQNQIDANAQLLDQIGKRDSNAVFQRHWLHARDVGGQMATQSMTTKTHHS